MASSAGFYTPLRKRRPFVAADLPKMLQVVDEKRVHELAKAMGKYIALNLPDAIRRKNELADYRTSPYVLMTTASTMRLEDSRDLAQFLINLKLYMGLEGSFGKSLEGEVLGLYPVGAKGSPNRWHEHASKRSESLKLGGLSREDRASARVDSVWREIDKACVVVDPRTKKKWGHLTSVKSGPATINDTQVAAMVSAIREQHPKWLKQSQQEYGVEGIDVVIGLTYGTDANTNNKENQILAKLLGKAGGFTEVDRANQPGVLVDASGKVRVYRRIGIEFWSYIGSPTAPQKFPFVFLEVLLGLAEALKSDDSRKEVEDALNERLDKLADAIKALRFPRREMPGWVKDTFTDAELTWLAAAIGSYFDAPTAEVTATESVVEKLAKKRK